MASRARRPSRASAGPSTARAALVALVVFVVALAPRLIGLGGAVTEDEDQWIARAGNFARALRAGEWRGSYQTGHPGVTTMWVVTLALGPERAARLADAGRATRLVTEAPDFLPAIRAARVPFAALNAALVAGIAFLAWRVLGAGPALFGTLLLALDPYWAAVGPIVGMDALLAGLIAISLLAWAQAWHGSGGGLGWAALSGGSWALAALTKTAAIFALPILPALPILVLARLRRPTGRHRIVNRLAMLGGAWLAAAAIAAFVAWPALWSDPLGAPRRAFEFSARLGGSAHGPGNFFLGQAIEDPGPLFYPVALALRVGPGTALGLMALLGFGVPRRLRQTVWALVGFAVLFGLLLTVSAKKVDRYLLPLLPILDLLAGIGWWRAARRLTRRAPRRPSTRYRVRAVLIGATSVILALQAWPLLGAGRYPLAAYNPLFGGAQAAERAIPVGWGDGLDDAGERLRELSGGRAITTAIWYPLWVNFQAHAPGRVVSDRQLAEADYFVDYVHARQRGTTPRPLTRRQPDAVVRIAGVDYARIYRLR